MSFSLLPVRFERLAKEGTWVVAGQIATVLGGLVLVRVLTEHLEPEQYGQLTLCLTVSAFFSQIVFGSVSNGIVRFYSIATEKEELIRYLYASTRMMGYATALVVLIGLVLILALLWLGYYQWTGLAFAALVFSLLSSYNTSLTGLQNAARQRSVAAFHTGLDAWLKILLAVGAMYWLGSFGTAVILSYALSALIVIGSQLYFLGRLPRNMNTATIDHENWERQIWLYSWPFATWGVFAWVQQVSDRWALQTFTNTQEIGLYAVLFQLGYSPISLLTSMVITYLAPILYQYSGNAKDKVRNKSVHLISWRTTFFALLMTLLAFIFTYSQHELIFKLLVASNYHVVSDLLPWMVLAGGLFSASQILLLKLQSEMKQSTMISAKILTAIIGISFNLYGASKFGLKGVVVAMLAFSVITLLWMAWLAYQPPALPEHNS